MPAARAALALALALGALPAVTACAPPPRALPADAPPGDAAPADAAPGPDPVALLQEIEGACSTSGWCWRRPRPRGVRINTIHATAPDNLWMVGDAGYVLQWDGARWREHALPEPPFRSTMNLGAVAGLGPREVWVGSRDLLYHWDGASWALRDTIPPGVDQAFHGIWEAPNRDVWIAMDYGVVRRSIAGGPLQTVDVPPAQAPLSELGSIWGTAANDVWIAGRPGRMFHWNGGAFTEHPTGTYKSGGNLDGASATEAWAGGYDGTLVRWNGASWAPVDTGLGTGWYMKGVAVSGATDVRWLAQKGSREAAILTWNGTALATEHIPTDVVLSDLEIVGGRWWIPADRGGVYVRQGPTAPIAAALEPALEPFRAIWGTADRNLYFVGPGRILRYDGAWTPAPIGGVYAVHGVSGTSDGGTDEVWAAGASPGASPGARAGDVFRMRGGTWTKTQVDPSRPLNAIWAAAPGEAIAVGDGGAVWRHAAGAWTQIPSPVTADLFGVWGPDPDRAWIVGAAGTILRWERAAPDVLVPEPSPTGVDLRAIHGADGVRWIATTGLGPDHLVAVLQSSGTGWIRHPVPNLLDGLAIHATSATDVMVVGANNAGRVFRWTGSAFVEERTGHAGSFSAVFRPPGGSPWIAGDGAVLQRMP